MPALQALGGPRKSKLQLEKEAAAAAEKARRAAEALAAAKARAAGAGVGAERQGSLGSDLRPPHRSQLEQERDAWAQAVSGGLGLARAGRGWMAAGMHRASACTCRLLLLLHDACAAALLQGA